jgi:HK97 family phage major capsid protein
VKYLEILRAQLAALTDERAVALTEVETIAEAAQAEERSALTTDEDATVAVALAKVDEIDTEIGALSERIGELEAVEARAAAARDAKVPTVIQRVPVADEARDVSRMSAQEARDVALKTLERKGDGIALNPESAAKVEQLIRSNKVDLRGDVVAKRLILTENDDYRSAWVKAVTETTPVFTAEEARALSEFRAASIGTDTAGGFGVPVLIDPSIILTSQGSLNPFRRISRVISITTDEWKGVSSAGVSWSYDAEAAAVSDDAPTLAQPNVVAHMARGFIPYSIEVGGDYPGFAAEMSLLLSEGYDELQASAFATGSGSSQPFGILTALDANTNVEVTPTTDGAFGAVDVNKVWGALPDRYKANATWVMNHDVGNEVSSFSTSGMGSFYTVDLSQGNAPQLKGRPVEFASYFPDFTGTTGASNILVVGDFRNYVIVERLGMSVELVPHLFDVTNNRPTGQRGWFAYARHGADSVNDLGFRLLQNQ